MQKGECLHTGRDYAGRFRKKDVDTRSVAQQIADARYALANVETRLAARSADDTYGIGLDTRSLTNLRTQLSNLQSQEVA